MRKSLFIILIFIISLTACIHKKKNSSPDVVTPKDSILVDKTPRTSITFILGKDENNHNPYYRIANQYYRINDSDKTEIVIDTIFSLLEVRNYLQQHPPKNGKPWGIINLVSHGNEFIDLSVKVFPHGPRTSVGSLSQAIMDSIFKPLDSTIIDKNSLLFLHGCAIGQNKALLNLLANAFGSKNNGCRLIASRLFEYYAYLSKNQNPKSIRHYYARVWYAFFKPDTVFDENAIVKQLTQNFHNEKQNWYEAIHRQHPSNPEEIYHIRFALPVVWEDFFKNEDQMPVLNTKTRKISWLESKTELMEMIEKTKIPLNYFQIKYYNSKIKTQKEELYLIKTKAVAGVICIIKPMINENSEFRFMPLNVDTGDTNFFSYSL